RRASVESPPSAAAGVRSASVGSARAGNPRVWATPAWVRVAVGLRSPLATGAPWPDRTCPRALYCRACGAVSASSRTAAFVNGAGTILSADRRHRLEVFESEGRRHLHQGLVPVLHVG